MRAFLQIAVPVILILAGTYYFFEIKNNSELDVLGEVNNFELIDDQSQVFGLNQLKDKVWIANFIFTSCQGVCPTMTKHMSLIQKNFKNSEQVEFVSFSVDPEKDLPQVLQEYRKKLQVDSLPNWHFLTGDREKIKKIMFEDMKLGYVEDVIFHSDRIVLMDGNAKIRGYYTGTEKKEFRKLSEDIAKLIHAKK